jgi:hypothetical protein
MEKLHLLKLRMGDKENDGGVNLTMMYCKDFVNVTIYPQYNGNMIIKKESSFKNCRR